MTTPDTDRVAATLAGIRADAQSLAQTNSPSWGTVPKIRRVIAGTERLLAAVDDALKLADDWKQEFARLEPSGADAASNAGPGSYLVSGRLGALEDCAEGLREAITAALAGEEAGDGK